MNGRTELHNPDRIISHHVEEFLQAKVTDTRVQNQGAKEEVMVSWKRPAMDFVKLNTDGSCLGNPGPIGAGGLIRDGSGKWLRGFVATLGHGTSMHAEIWAVAIGLD